MHCAESRVSFCYRGVLAAEVPKNRKIRGRQNKRNRVDHQKCDHGSHSANNPNYRLNDSGWPLMFVAVIVGVFAFVLMLNLSGVRFPIDRHD